MWIGSDYRRIFSTPLVPPRWSLFASILLYGGCLPLTAFCELDVANKCARGWDVLLFGALGILIYHVGLTWFSNLLLFAAWCGIWSGRSTWPLVTSVVALLLGGSFYAAKIVVANEGAVPVPVASYNMGYWLWLASMAAIPVGALFNKTSEPSLDPDQSRDVS